MKNIQVKNANACHEFGSQHTRYRTPDMNNVAAIRKARRLTQADLAELAGVEQPTISRLERGSESVTLRTIVAVASALDVPISDLFSDRAEAERIILRAYRSLPPDRQAGWVDMAHLVLGETRTDDQSSSKTG